jgi:chemotaxis protein CheD
MSKQRKIIHVSDAKVSKDSNDLLITYSLGSCIGVCLYDPAAHIGGMLQLHYQLPDSKIDPDKAKEKPFMFADSGIKILVDKLVSMGANKKRMMIKIAGGANMDTGPKGFDIGKRNHLALRKIMWKNGIFIDSEDVGGNSPRNLYLDIADGSVTIKSNGVEKNL